MLDALRERERRREEERRQRDRVTLDRPPDLDNF